MKRVTQAALLFLGLPLLTLAGAYAHGPEPPTGEGGPREDIYAPQRTLAIGQVSSKITIDGVLDEAAWQGTTTANQFINKFPIDSGLAVAQTQVRIAYDAEYIYVAATCQMPGNASPSILTLRRDNEDGYWGSDAFTVVLDPFGQQSNGFLFGVTAAGAQMEALLRMQGVNTEYDQNWDNKWYSATTRSQGVWYAEMAIPFKTLRYNSELAHWGINFLRNDMTTNVYSTWNRVPLGFNGTDLGHMAQLAWDAPPRKAKGNYSIIPYAAGGTARDLEARDPYSLTGSIGADAKVAVTGSLNLDLTLNPDFSNVDVDQQVTNLNRFSIFFPERRNFFLENADLFSSFGSWGARPFFSRQIGIHEGSPVPIAFGARLSGNLTDDVRIGVMNVQTRATEELSAQNYTVAAVHKRVLARSTVRGLFINRQGFQQGINGEDFNRAGGLEFEYLSQNGKWNATARYHVGADEQRLDKNSFANIQVNYNSRNVNAMLRAGRMGENYINDVGFVPRLNNYDYDTEQTVRIGYQFANLWSEYVHWGKKGSWYNNIEMGAWGVQFTKLDGTPQESTINAYTNLNLANRSRIRLRVRRQDVTLPFRTDFLGEDKPLPAARYRFTNSQLEFNTDNRKMVSISGRLGYGGFYSGKNLEMGGTLTLRKQPWGTLGIDYTQNNVDLGPEYGSSVLRLIGPRAEVSFSNNMFWTTFVQYNTQADNVNINSRFQWRYAPMSDLFVVYSENYTPAFASKNRALVFKLTYWLNL